MDLLTGFEWPVPRAFAAAVSVCRFEQGDVFYDTPNAYTRWPARRAKRAGRWVQVLDPPRTARSAPADAEGSRFVANWASPVTVLTGRSGEPADERFESTQGRLFTCLWRGTPGLLADAGPVDPPLPVGARDLQKQLEGTVSALRAAFSGQPRLFFVSVVDESNEASLAKQRAVESALASGGGLQTASLAPKDAGVPDGDSYHPALRVHASAPDPSGAGEVDVSATRALLKRALYAPTRSGGEPGADRFKLERHGLLVGDDASPDEQG